MAVGPDAVPTEFLKVLADAGDPDTLVSPYEIIIAVWTGGGATQEWKGATIKVLHKKNSLLVDAVLMDNMVQPQRKKEQG